MNRINRLQSAAVALACLAGLAVAATPAQIETVVDRFVRGSAVVLSQYSTLADRITAAALDEIRHATTIPEAGHAANVGRTKLSVASGEARDDKEQQDLDSLRDYERRAVNELKAIGASTSHISGPSAARKAAIQRTLEAHKSRIKAALEARRAELQRRR